MNSDNQAAESSSSKTEGEGNGIFRGANTIDPQYATYVKAVYSDMAGRGGAAVADVASKNPGAERGGRITSSPGDDFQSSLHSKRHLYNRMRQQLTKTSPTSADPRAVLGAGETQDGLPPPPPPPIKTYTTSERTLIEKALRETKLTVAEQRVAVCHFLHSDSIIFIFILFLDVQLVLLVQPYSYDAHCSTFFLFHIIPMFCFLAQPSCNAVRSLGARLPAWERLAAKRAAAQRGWHSSTSATTPRSCAIALHTAKSEQRAARDSGRTPLGPDRHPSRRSAPRS